MFSFTKTSVALAYHYCARGIRNTIRNDIPIPEEVELIAYKILSPIWFTSLGEVPDVSLMLGLVMWIPLAYRIIADMAHQS